MTLDSFFTPKSIAVVGVSDNPSKLGAVVFSNIIEGGFEGCLYGINPKLGGQQISGKDCYATLEDLPHTVDLVIILVPARFTEPVIDSCVKLGVPNISIITAGFSEVGEKELEHRIAEKCINAGINLLGPNCMGHISTYSNLNATFADGMPQKGNVAFISQSGAYCSAMMDWAASKNIGFSHFISIGNKAVMGEDKLLAALKDSPDTDAFVFYLESLKNGKEFLSVIKEVSNTKPCVIMEPGKSSKAQAASLSHTGSLAPNYRVLEMALQGAGAIQARNGRELFSLLEILQYCNHNEFDGNIAVLTNAGGVGVLTSDLCEDAHLNLERPSEATIEKLHGVLTAEASLGNPIDVVGDAGADRYENALRILCESKEYKNIIVLLTPQRVTDCMGTAEAIIKCSKEFQDINILSVFQGGASVEEARELLSANRMLHYEYPVDCVSLLGLLKAQMAYRGKTLPTIEAQEVPAEIKAKITEAKEANLASLPQTTVNMLMDHYGLDYPRSGNFDDKDSAMEFCKGIFPKPLVLKLSAPDALHKTEMKGIYLNINDEISFTKAWASLWNTIEQFSLKGASVLIQEMITDATETIIGMNSDKNFGRVLVFGTGGVYTEVMRDTSMRILPCEDFDAMIKETKVGTILHGVRGQQAKAVGPLADTLAKVQQLVTDIPEITSIDGNPVLVTADRAVIVDFKMILK